MALDLLYLGLFVGIDRNQPLYDTRQLTSEVIGFLTPNQLADLALAEVDDLVEFLAPVLTPIYGAVGILRYPTKPLSVMAQVRNHSILTFVKNRRPDSYEDVVREGFLLLVPRMYTTIKSEAQQEENLVGFMKARGKKTAERIRTRELVWRAP